MTELVDGCLECDGPPISLLKAPSASTSVSPAGKPLFSSSLGVFHAAISSSSIGETPRERNGKRFRRVLQHINTTPAISTSPTAESTVLKVMTSVLLLPIPESSVVDGPVAFELSVVVGRPVELVISVGIVSVSPSPLDVCQSTVSEVEGVTVGEGVVVKLADRGDVVPSEFIGLMGPMGSEAVGPGTGTVSVVVVVGKFGNHQGGPLHCFGSITGPG